MIFILWALVIAVITGFVVRMFFMIPMSLSDKLVIKRLADYSGNIHKKQIKTGVSSTLTQLSGPSKGLIKQWPVKELMPILLQSKKRVKFDGQLRAANLEDQLSIEEFYGVKLLMAIFLPLCLITFLSGNGILTIFILFVAALGGYVLPNYFLKGMVEERQSHIRRFFPDAIDLLIVGMEAGLGFDRALRMYCERFKGPLSEEFKKMLASIDVGQTRRQALRELAERNQLEDINVFVSSILQAEKLGTPLAEILTLQSETARTMHRQWVQELTAKAPIKIIFPLAGLILPALFAVLLGPIVIQMMTGGGL